MKPFGVVYMLADSRAPLRPKYVGQTRTWLATRLHEHLRSASAKREDGTWKNTYHSMNGIRALLREGAEVLIFEEARCYSKAELDVRERAFIAAGKASGCCEWNTLPGGEANPTDGLSPEQLSARNRKVNAALTPEQRTLRAMNAGRASVAAFTSEQRREIARMVNARRTSEERRALSQKANASRTPEAKQESARRMRAALSPDQRRDNARKASAARWARHVKQSQHTDGQLSLWRSHE